VVRGVGNAEFASNELSKGDVFAQTRHGVYVRNRAGVAGDRPAAGAVPE